MKEKQSYLWPQSNLSAYYLFIYLKTRFVSIPDNGVSENLKFNFIQLKTQG